METINEEDVKWCIDESCAETNYTGIDSAIPTTMIRCE